MKGAPLLIFASVAILSACSAPREAPDGVVPAIGTPTKQHSSGIVSGDVNGLAHGSSYEVLHDFRGGSEDGVEPEASLINIRGTLYGTTSRGGTSGYGTVFSITKNGTENVVYSFVGGGDGAYPDAALINVNGTLFGTTAFGGSGCGNIGCGTVFSITTGGKEKVLYTFGSRSEDGAEPVAGLINVRGTLYGTTLIGGASGRGTVFSVTRTGKEKTVYSFRGGHDGDAPDASLVDVNGILYGTTILGGHSGCVAGCGTVFKVTTTGKESVLHGFRGGSDGAVPGANLIEVNGLLYGVTSEGGSGCGSFGCGTVFSVTTSGKKNVLYTFSGGADGGDPFASFINVNGTLYSTTAEGGANNDGTVFSITPTGSENVLYSFAGGSDGLSPHSSLINVTGALYGTTFAGGGHGCRHHIGCGTVFALTP